MQDESYRTACRDVASSFRKLGGWRVLEDRLTVQLGVEVHVTQNLLFVSCRVIMVLQERAVNRKNTNSCNAGGYR